MRMTQTTDTIGDAAMTLQTARSEYLTERGWKLKCDLPGSRWLWQKRFDDDGRVMAMPMDVALLVQGVIDSREEGA